MAEPVTRMDDLRYRPSSPERREPAGAEAAGPALLPGTPVAFVEPDEHRSPRLDNTAGAIGNAVGAAVDRVRHLPERFSEMKQRFTVIRGRARDKSAVAAEDLKETARVRTRQAQMRVQHLANEYPVQFILGVAGAAFVMGFILRIWRSRRA